jgi:hypothetical protein
MHGRHGASRAQRDDSAPVWRHVLRESEEWLETTLDDRAMFLLCDIASPSQIRIAATSGDRTAETTIDVDEPAPLRIVDLNVALRPAQRQDRVYRPR